MDKTDDDCPDLLGLDEVLDVGTSPDGGDDLLSTPPPPHDEALSEHKRSKFDVLNTPHENDHGELEEGNAARKPEIRDEGRHDDEWPWLDGSGESQNQEILLQVHTAYEKCRCTVPPAFITIKGKDVPIFKRPPGFESNFVKHLEDSARQWALPTFKMGEAVCIVDSTTALEAEPSVAGHRVSFPGVKDRALSLVSPETNVYVARRGASKIPETSTVKPWRIDVVKHKDEPSSTWYVCLFVPRQARPRNSRQPGAPGTVASSSPAVSEVTGPSGGHTEPDSEIASFVDSFVDLLVDKARSAGLLSEPGDKGKEQEKRFRKSLTATLQRVVKPFTVRDLNPKWADHVFKDSYGRLSLSQVFEHIDKKGHLPWIRPQHEVQEHGVDLVEDHVNLLEAVENLYLYVRELGNTPDAGSQPPETEQHFWSDMEQRRLLDQRRRLRGRCWQALREDDAKGLVGAVAEGAAEFGVDERELLVLLQRWLWKEDKGKGKAQDPQGLVAAAAGNRLGVPPDGALMCLKTLLARYALAPRDRCPLQLGLALQKAQALHRTQAVTLLRAAIAAQGRSTASAHPQAGRDPTESESRASASASVRRPGQTSLQCSDQLKEARCDDDTEQRRAAGWGAWALGAARAWAWGGREGSTATDRPT